jgi:hypothetical protein
MKKKKSLQTPSKPVRGIEGDFGALHCGMANYI